MEADKEYKLLIEMCEQGEFSCLVHANNWIVQWWCRKMDKEYESKAPTLWDALISVLGQAEEDPEPWVTEEELKESAEKYKINIYIPDPSDYEPQYAKEPSWKVYIIKCLDQTLYCGVTNDILNRINDHNIGKGAKYTKSRRPVSLKWYSKEMFKRDAYSLEYKIKQLPRYKKWQLIKGEIKEDEL
jgi:putative endonuclease